MVPLSRPSIVLSQATVSYPIFISSDYRTEVFTRSVSFPIGSDLIIKGQTDRDSRMSLLPSDTVPLDSEKREEFISIFD